MIAGISGDKGGIHLSFGNPLIEDFENKRELAKAIDKAIHNLYKFWPGNYIAYDQLYETDKYYNKYTDA